MSDINSNEYLKKLNEEKKNENKKIQYKSKKLKKKLLIDLYPELLNEWNYEKNKEININLITIGSHLIVWWICPNKHNYQARIFNRTLRKTKCKICHHDKYRKINKNIKFKLKF